MSDLSQLIEDVMVNVLVAATRESRPKDWWYVLGFALPAGHQRGWPPGLWEVTN